MVSLNLSKRMIQRRIQPTSVLLMILVIQPISGQTVKCHPAEYQVGNACCPKCPAGNRVKTECTDFRSTSCLPCQEGTFVDRLSGLKACLTCTTCDSGSGLTIKRSCTATSDAVCKPLEGFRCIDFKGDSCEAAAKHKSCNPGQYISQKGTDSTDTVCSDCREGTFSNGTISLCQPHTKCEELNLQLIKAGTVLADAECGEHSLKTGAIVAICLFFACILLGVVFVIVFCLRRKEKCHKGFAPGGKRDVATRNPEEMMVMPT